MIIKDSEKLEKKYSKDCTVFEYDCPSTNFSIATASINGRYPKANRVANMECEEIYYVISGAGIIHSEKGDFKVQEGNLYHFSIGETYWIEGKNLFLVLANSPKWKQSQHKIIE